MYIALLLHVVCYCLCFGERFKRQGDGVDGVEITLAEDFAELKLFLSTPLDDAHKNWVIEAEGLRTQIISFIGAREIEVPTVTIYDEKLISVVALVSVTRQIKELLMSKALVLETTGGRQIFIDIAVLGLARDTQMVILHVDRLPIDRIQFALEGEFLKEQISQQLFIQPDTIYEIYIPIFRTEIYMIMNRKTALEATLNLLGTTLNLVTRGITREQESIVVNSFSTSEVTPRFEEILFEYRYQFTPQNWAADKPRLDPESREIADERDIHRTSTNTLGAGRLKTVVPNKIFSRKSTVDLPGKIRVSQGDSPRTDIVGPLRSSPRSRKQQSEVVVEEIRPLANVAQSFRQPPIDVSSLPTNPGLRTDDGVLVQSQTFFTDDIHDAEYLELHLISRDKFKKIPARGQARNDEQEHLKRQIAYALGVSGDEIATLMIFTKKKDGPKVVVVGTADVVATLNRVLRDGRLHLQFSNGATLRLASTSVQRAEDLQEVVLDVTKMLFNKKTENLYNIQAFRYHLETQLRIPRRDIEHIIINKKLTQITFVLSRGAALKLQRALRDGSFTLTTEFNERVVVNYWWSQELRPKTIDIILKSLKENGAFKPPGFPELVADSSPGVGRVPVTSSAPRRSETAFKKLPVQHDTRYPSNDMVGYDLSPLPKSTPSPVPELLVGKDGFNLLARTQYLGAINAYGGPQFQPAGGVVPGDTQSYLELLYRQGYAQSIPEEVLQPQQPSTTTMAPEPTANSVQGQLHERLKKVGGVRFPAHVTANEGESIVDFARDFGPLSGRRPPIKSVQGPQAGLISHPHGIGQLDLLEPGPTTGAIAPAEYAAPGGGIQFGRSLISGQQRQFFDDAGKNSPPFPDILTDDEAVRLRGNPLNPAKYAPTKQLYPLQVGPVGSGNNADDFGFGLIPGQDEDAVRARLEGTHSSVRQEPLTLRRKIETLEQRFAGQTGPVKDVEPAAGLSFLGETGPIAPFT